MENQILDIPYCIDEMIPSNSGHWKFISSPLLARASTPLPQPRADLLRGKPPTNVRLKFQKLKKYKYFFSFKGL
jgi:hypothetical protein